MKKELILDGLDCANCAVKIESKVNEIDGLKGVSLNFVTKTLSMETEQIDKLETFVSEIKAIVNTYEPDVKVVEKVLSVETKQDSMTRIRNIKENNGKDLFLLGIGLILYAIAIIFDLVFWQELTLYLLSYMMVGSKVLIRAVKNITKGQIFDENFLMSIATIGAFLIGEYPEAVAVMLFYQIGELFQSAAINRSRNSIAELMDIRPAYANLEQHNEIKLVSPEEVNIGDIIVIKPGEKVPLDGVIIEGNSMLDTLALTGESVPREAEIGNEVLSGFINKNGLLKVKVSKKYQDSTVAKILDLVENASNRKAPTENFITKFARYYTPIVVFSAVIIALLPPLIIEGATFSEWIYKALIFLVISCPCALVISIPLGFFGGIGGASKNGILIKGSNYLEALNNVDTIIFDKTGTLTKGVFEVNKIVAKNKRLTEAELLKYASYAEVYSNHPIAESIKNTYGNQIDNSLIEIHEDLPGQGAKVKAFGKEIIVGNSKLMSSLNIIFDSIQEIGTIVHVAIDREYSGYIVISDEIKIDARETISSLKNFGINNIVMLTGDNKNTGQMIANELGIDKFYAELLPNQKVEKLEEIDKQKLTKGKTVFVGDGINDAPVLARADIGVAMGGLGSDAAIEAADIVIMNDQPLKIISAIKIAKRTRVIVWQNIILALGVKLLVLVLGVFGLATMWEAVFADVGVAVIAIFNAMRVLNIKE